MADIIKTLETAADGPEDPLALFEEWMEEAKKSEPSDPNAMTLATVKKSGAPGARIVLLKALDERGFVFYTNRESDKGNELAATPVAALCFHWKSLGRQVRIEGDVEMVGDEESDSYYVTRPEGSRIGAWASQQSRPLESRSALKASVAAYSKEFSGKDDIPRPPHWGGYRVKAKRIEFWHDGEYRLHTRLIYKRNGEKWEKEMLFP